MQINLEHWKYKEYQVLQQTENKYKIFIKNIIHFSIKIFIILIIVLRIIKTIGLSSLRMKQTKKIYKKYNNKKGNKTTQYYSCFCSMGKKENLYIRELISYYINLGVDKFVLGDNNLPNDEKFSDVLQDYISNGTVDVIDIIGKSYDQSEYFEILYQKYKHKCDWLTFFDLDEYLVLYSDEGNKITINEFLSNKKFNKCSAISFNWLMYGDNDLVYYDNRTSIERFTKPDYSNRHNRFIKSVVRGNLNGIVFRSNESCHMPQINVSQCDSTGKLISHTDKISPPIFRNGYIMHFNTRTAEEYTKKMIRGYQNNKFFRVSDRVNLFFYHNKLTKEKLRIFEKVFNRTFRVVSRHKN